MDAIRKSMRLGCALWPLTALNTFAAAHITCPGSDDIVLDCNGNGTDDYCDITLFATSADANTNGIPDECDVEECLANLCGGFDSATVGTLVNGLDCNGDGITWINPSGTWTFGSGGCPGNSGRSAKGVAQTPPISGEFLKGELFHTNAEGRAECAAYRYRFTADLRTEASRNPRIDWQIMLKESSTGDPATDPTVILIHLPSTQSMFAGVGTNRGRMLVRDPNNLSAFLTLDPEFVIPANTCYRVELELDNNAPRDSAVKLYVNDTLRLATKRLNPAAGRMDYLYINQVANGQAAGGTNRVALDNVTVCRLGPPLDWPDCNTNCVDDAFDIALGSSPDCAASLQGVPDECEPDCNSNGTPDACDLASGTSHDCNTNSLPDECDIAIGTSLDCNTNGIPEECDLSSGTSLDCNTNGQPDGCDILLGASPDCNRNLIPDLCDLHAGFAADCNTNQIPDECDVGGASLDWRLRPTLGPRTGHAMTYDDLRQRTVLFGGVSIPSYDRSYDETWEWDGAKWSLRTVGGPRARSGHALAYDSSRRVAVLFGGYGIMGLVAETWEWNGLVWNQRQVTGPSARSGHAMAYDSARKVTVLFGGSAVNTNPYSDTWEWNGVDWVLRTTTGPSPRSRLAMAYDSNRGVMVLFGGDINSSPFNSVETWEWDGEVWTLRATEGPGPGIYQMAYDDSRGLCILLGGPWGPGSLLETWEWDGSSWMLRSADGPLYRAGQGVAYDQARGVTVMFGGSDYTHYLGGDFGDTWEWDGTEWSLAASGGPSGLSDSPTVMSYDSAREASLVFVNYDPHSVYIQTAEWDGQSWNLRDAGGPSERGGHAVTYDSTRRVTVLFGGYGGGLKGDTWEWNGQLWTLRAETGPSPRTGHALAYDAARGATVLFGGSDALGRSGETWTWNGSTWTLRATEGPSPRQGHLMAYDTLRERVVLFGGGNSRETWEWNGDAWTLRLADSPPSSARFMVFDSGRSVTAVHASNALWEWDGAVWTRRDLTTSLYPTAMTYDITRRTRVGYVGHYGQVWELSPRSHDCNLNGIPDSCESVGPCARIRDAGSWRTHGGGVERDQVSIDPSSRVAIGGVSSESRSGGIEEIRLTFNVAPGAVAAKSITVEQRTCGDAGTYVPYEGNAQPTATLDGHDVVVTFTPALENAATYRMTLPPEVTAVPDRFVEVRCLAGDVNSDGRVNAADRSRIVGVWTGASYSPATDITLDGRTDSTDRSVVVGIWIGTENCSP